MISLFFAKFAKAYTRKIFNMVASQKLSFHPGRYPSILIFVKNDFEYLISNFRNQNIPNVNQNCFALVRFLRGCILKVQSWKLQKRLVLLVRNVYRKFILKKLYFCCYSVRLLFKRKQSLFG